MLPRGPIFDYVDELGGALGFDPALARRVCDEVEDHLRESVAAHPAGAPAVAEARAIARFGPSREIAAQFAVDALLRHARAVAIAALLVIVGTFVAMLVRPGWSAGAQDAVTQPGVILLAIDRLAFCGALAVALLGWAHGVLLRPTVAFDRRVRRRLRRSLILGLVAAGGLAISVGADTALVVLSLWRRETSLGVLWPVLLTLAELALVGLLGTYLRGFVRRTASSSALAAIEPRAAAGSIA